jgi:DNA-binding PadR family transcriptional regulator
MVELIILGIITHAGRSLHGYEIKKYMKAYHVGEYARVSYGSIYYNLGRLERGGLIKGTSVKDTQRPERRLYEITAKGKARLKKLLRQNYSEIERLYHAFDIGVSMMELMPKDEVLAALEKRIDNVEVLLKMHRKEKDAHQKQVPFWVPAIFDHALYYFEAEKKWLESLKQRVMEAKDWWGDKIDNHSGNSRRREKADEHGRDKPTYQGL